MTLPGTAKQKQAGGVRGGLLFLGLLLIVASGGAFWYILRELDVRDEYLVTARTIERREIASPGDFEVIRANLGDGRGMPPQFLGIILGRWATGRIPSGTIVTPGMFQDPPLSNDGESDKVLIEVSLPAGEAPGGSLVTGDRIALFGADRPDSEFGRTAVGLIGVLELGFVDGDEISYLVTPAEAMAIQDLVDRYVAASDRRIWELGFDLSADDLADLYAAPETAPVVEDTSTDPSDTTEPGGNQ